MKITSQLKSLTMKALSQSMDVQTMIAMVRELHYNYDIHKQTGYADSIPIPKMTAAEQIVNDINKMNLFPQFINQIILLHKNGHMGKKFPVKFLREIFNEIKDQGLLYDNQYNMFVENPEVRITRNWGTLQNNNEYYITFLRLDIVGNSKLVREYDNKIIQRTYNDLKEIVEKAASKRNARIWNWEGDGGTVAFFFTDKNLFAVLSAMEIVHELFLYNKMRCLLKKPLGVRIAVHAGPFLYSDNEEDLKKNDTIKKLIEMEAKHTKPNTFTISSEIVEGLDPVLYNLFGAIKIDQQTSYYNYELRWESV